jgi:hypothetical protein
VRHESIHIASLADKGLRRNDVVRLVRRQAIPARIYPIEEAYNERDEEDEECVEGET